MLDEVTPQRARLPGKVFFFYGVLLPCREEGIPLDGGIDGALAGPKTEGGL